MFWRRKKKQQVELSKETKDETPPIDFAKEYGSAYTALVDYFNGDTGKADELFDDKRYLGDWASPQAYLEFFMQEGDSAIQVSKETNEQLAEKHSIDKLLMLEKDGGGVFVYIKERA